MSTEQEIENSIVEKGLTAPRLTPEHIDSVIAGKTFTVLPSGKCMVCELTLANGYTLRGEASTVSKENFNQEIGEKISFENARRKICSRKSCITKQKAKRKRKTTLPRMVFLLIRY